MNPTASPSEGIVGNVETQSERTVAKDSDLIINKLFLRVDFPFNSAKVLLNKQNIQIHNEVHGHDLFQEIEYYCLTCGLSFAVTGLFCM